MRCSTSEVCFPINVILVRIGWYAAYPLSYRHLEQIRKECDISVDRPSINRWAIRFLPLIEKMGRKHKRPVGGSSRMDETDIKIKGVSKPLPRCRQARQYCRLPADGHAPHDTAKSCFGKTMSANGTPDMVAMDRSGPNRAAIDEIDAGLAVLITVRQVKYLNNIAEQNHRATKRIIRPMLDFK